MTSPPKTQKPAGSAGGFRRFAAIDTQLVEIKAAICTDLWAELDVPGGPEARMAAR